MNKKILSLPLVLLFIISFVSAAVDVYNVSTAGQNARVRSDGSSYGTDPSSDNMVVGRSGAAGYYFWHSGFIFYNVSEQPNIINAWLQFTGRLTRTGVDYTADVFGEDTDNALSYSVYGNLLDRTKTTAYADWTTPTDVADGTVFNTTNVTSVLKEIWARGGWVDGNNVSFLIYTDSGTEGDDINVYFNSNGEPTKTAKLFIEYATEAPPVPPNISNLSIQAIDIFNSTYLTNFTALVDNVLYQSNTTGYIITHLLDNATALYNITINSSQNGGYYTKNYLNYNVSNDLIANLTKYFRVYSAEYTNYISNGTIDFVRQLNYTINYTCPSFSNATIYTYINGKAVTTDSQACNNNSLLITGTYTPVNETEFNIKHSLNTSYLANLNNEYTAEDTYQPDLYAPVVEYINFTFVNGFASLTTDTAVLCTDTIYSPLLYNISWNNNTIYSGYKNNNTLVENTTYLTNGNNTLNVYCSDLFYTTNRTRSKVVYVKQFILIDEIEGSDFDLDNLSIIKVYFEDNETLFDFKAEDTNSINFTSDTNDKLRFELGYYDSTTINRYVDVSLVENDLRICVNKDNVIHYQILLTSATPKAAVLKNIYANCIVAADYTRFAYQDGVLLQAHTINSVYSLYTYDSGERVYLASVDGSLATDIDINTLIFKQTAYNFNLLKDDIAFQKNGSSQVIIRYYNPKGNNQDIDLTITRLDNSDIVYTETDFSNPNMFTLYFNYASLENVTNETTFKISIIKTLTDGSLSTINEYFNVQGGTGILNSQFAAIISFILVFIGLTLLAARTSLGWFGMVIYLAGIAVLSFSPLVWYSLLLLAIYIISLVFLVVNAGVKGYAGAA